MKKLYRSKKDRLIGGICGGIGDYINIDSNVLRILWVLSILILGFGILAYILCWILIPEKE